MQQMQQQMKDQMQEMKDHMIQQFAAIQQPVQPVLEVPIPDVENKLICVSGIFNLGQRDVGVFIESKGFRYSETMKISCDYLIASPIDHQSKKVDFAKEYNVPIRDAKFLADLLGVDNV